MSYKKLREAEERSEDCGTRQVLWKREAVKQREALGVNGC